MCANFRAKVCNEKVFQVLYEIARYFVILEDRGGSWKMEDWRLKIKNKSSRFKIEYCRFKIEEWTLKIEDWRLKIEDWRLKIEDWNWRLKIEDWRLNIEDRR